MRTIRCLLREQQRCLLDDERSEVRVILEVEHDGNTGHLLYEADYHKRDCESETRSDVPGVTGDFLAYGYQLDPPWELDDVVWSTPAEATKGTPETHAIVCRLRALPVV